ncbi:MAG: ion transporter [Spirochaetales bacterium]|nr:ion transporter [Spirochaetales bacterium]
MEKNKINIFEAIVTAVIGLVVIQTFLEDFAVVMNWDLTAARILMITGFCFDLFFTIEFLVRLYNSRFEKGALFYLIHGQGWVDFFASIPLLILVSGPVMISFISSETGMMNGLSFAGFLSMLKLIKTIRIARILRLLRVIKIFKSIKYADSSMAQRHVRKIITIGVSCLVISLLVFTLIFESSVLSKTSGLYDVQKSKIESSLEKSEKEGNFDKIISGLSRFDAFHSILIIKRNGRTLYTRYSKEIYDSEFSQDDYEYRKKGDLEIFFEIKEENKAIGRIQSGDSLIFFFIVLVLILSLLFLYSPHFALTISDPVYVMKRGLEEKSYNLEVKIPELYKDDDIFKLAALYNEGYLPLKDRNLSSEEHSVLDVGLADLKTLIDET